MQALLRVVAVNQLAWLETTRTDDTSWESYTETSNRNLIDAVDDAKKFAQATRFKEAYIKLKNIKPIFSCYEVTEYIAAQLKKGVCDERMKAVRHKEKEGGKRLCDA